MATGLSQQPSRWKQAFFIALITGAVLFLPFVIMDGGYFIYYGDFNVQQIPFYKLAHEAVRSGDFFWNWYTDLGVNFIGSYSFYLLFSPFFWLTLPFPTHVLPYLMAPLLILKTACASLTAYLYLERFVRDRAFAVIGGLLYAFSGWMFFNIFFNHFHDVAVFFPLLLLSLEKLVWEDAKGWFALAVAANAMVNYWFFVGEAVFVALYVLVRTCTKGWAMTPGKFLRICAESVLGVGMVAAAMLPSVMALAGNPRTGPERLLTGWRLWLYSHEQRQPAIVHSLFMPPELPARPNFFPDHGAKWASLSGWLPLVGMTGVLSYFFQRKNDWLKRMLALCLVFAMVPGLNSLFVLLNNSYYARWFYMPVLLMSLATILALEHSAQTSAHFVRAIKWSAIIVTLFTVMSGLTPHVDKEGTLSLGSAPYPRMLWAYAILSVICLILTAVLVVFLRRHRRFHLMMTCSLVAIILTFGIFYMANGKNTPKRSQFITGTAIQGREEVHLPQEPFARTDVYDIIDNMAMFWHLPTIQTFHSVVPPSIMEFYPSVGVKRDVGSRPEEDTYALRPLLSVRWLLIEESNEEQQPMPGYTYYATVRGINIYENEHYIPMGFGYTEFVTQRQLEEADEADRANLMLRAVVLDQETAMRHADILHWLDTDTRKIYFGYERMATDAANRREQAAYNFQKDNRGFTAHTALEQETLMFFSVPWEAGWSATVNGRAVPIERANVGFMAVRVPAGETVIRFSYITPGLWQGLVISTVFLGLWILYMSAILCHSHKTRRLWAERKSQALFQIREDAPPEEALPANPPEDTDV